MGMNKRLVEVVLLIAAFLAISANGRAQSVRGSMAGTVTDPSGAVVSGAQVEAKNQSTGVVTDTVTTSSGSYRFPELPLGTYDVTITAPGFGTQVQRGVLVTINNTTALNVTVKPGGAATTVSVDASAPTLQTESSDVGGTVSSKQIIDLPLALGGVGALRSPEAFAFLLPGTTGPGTGNNPNGIFISKIGGGQNFANEVLIDGASQTRSENGSSFDEEAPSVEALQEFKITTATPQAEFGRTTGGIEDFVTKSGTNQLHGTAFDIFRNDALDANTWFNNGYLAQCAPGDAACRATNSRPVDKKNDFGGSLGGPVRIPKIYNGTDKSFFFFAWEQIRYTLGTTATSTVPTVAERNGDFSSPAIFRTDLPPLGTNPCDGTPIYQGQIFDPATQTVVAGVPCRTAFAGNRVDPGRFSNVAKNLLPYYPLPTNGGQTNNFTFRANAPLTNTTYTVRIDHSLSDKSKIFASYSTRENTRISGTPALLPDPVDPNTWPQDFLTHFGRAGWDYSFTPNLLNHFNFGSNRSNSINFAQAIHANKNWVGSLGIGNIVSKNFPEIVVGETIVRLGNPNQNDDNVDNGLRFNDSVNWQHGRHSFKFGADYRWQQYSPIVGNSPRFTFARAETAADPNSTGQSGNGFASLLLGTTDNASQNIVPKGPRWTSHYYALFAQDDLKLSNHLTVNLGVRWDVDMPRTEAHGQTSNFSPTALDPQYGVPGALVFGTNCKCNTRWADTWYKDVSPRIGFAYTPPVGNGKTVFRGGFSIFYGPLQYADFGGAMNTGYKANPTAPSRDAFSPSFNIDSGFPAFAPPPNLDPGYFNGTFVGGAFIGKDQGRPAMVDEWQLQMQQELAQDLILTVGYVGHHAQNLRSGLQNINNISKNDFALGDQLGNPLSNNTAGVSAPFAGFTQLWGSGVQLQQALRPFPQYGFIATDCCLQNVGMSSYNALLVSLERRFRNGVNLQLSYTWAKDLTNSDSALPGINAGVSQIQDPTDLHTEKSISTQDIPQTLVISWLYELPFGRNKTFLNHGLASYVAGGWQLGGVQRYQSGEPISFGCGTGIPGWDNCVRFTRVPGSSLESPVARHGHINPFSKVRSDPNVNSLFNENTFQDPVNGAFLDQNDQRVRNGGPFRLGTGLPRVTGEYRMNAYLNEDFSLQKATPIREGLNFVLKFELLNAFNRHAFGIPDVNPNDNNFGVPTYTINGPRNVQVTGRITF
jgi:hypothetical protein